MAHDLPITMWLEAGTGRYGNGNGGYVLLAAVVERAAAMPFAEFPRREIFTPLATRGTDVDDVALIVRHRASGYVPGPAPARVQHARWSDMSSNTGSGSLLSTAADLHRWALAVRAEWLYKRSALQYPYGWGVRRYFDRDAIEQSGIVDGFTSYLALYLADGTTVVCLTNVQAGLHEQCGKDIAAMVFGVPLPSRPSSRHAVPSPVNRALIGAYAAPDVGRFELLERDGHLYARWGPPRLYNIWSRSEGTRSTPRVDRSTIVFHRDSTTAIVRASRIWDGFTGTFARKPKAAEAP